MSDLQGKKPIRMCSCGADSEDLLTYFCDGHCIACKRCGDKATSRFPGDNKFAPLRRWNIKHQAMPWASPSPETPVSLRLLFMTANEKSAAL